MTHDDRLSPQNCVLVIIDLQNDFCHPDGVKGKEGADLSRVDRAVDNVIDLIGAARTRGVPIVHVRTTHDASTNTPQWLGRRRGGEADNCVPDSWGSEFYRVEVLPGDAVVVKHRYGAFANTGLNEHLQSLGRRSVVVCGVATDVCVETTLREAVCLDYWATMVTDGCSASTVKAHEAAVESIGKSFGFTLTAQEIQDAWARSAA